MQGTITWFDCKAQLPPQNKNSNTSILVLAFDDNDQLPYVCFYMHDVNKWFGKTPTHWAFINKPDTNK